jgi:hypothetical protein
MCLISHNEKKRRNKNNIRVKKLKQHVKINKVAFGAKSNGLIAIETNQRK